MLLFLSGMDQKLPASEASVATNMHADATLDLQYLFGVYKAVTDDFLCEIELSLQRGALGYTFCGLHLPKVIQKRQFF